MSQKILFPDIVQVIWGYISRQKGKKFSVSWTLHSSILLAYILVYYGLNVHVSNYVSYPKWQSYSNFSFIIPHIFIFLSSQLVRYGYFFFLILIYHFLVISFLYFAPSFPYLWLTLDQTLILLRWVSQFPPSSHFLYLFILCH